MNAQKVWASILAGVKSQVSSSAFKTWFAGSFVLDLKKTGSRDVLVVGLKNNFLKEQIETKYFPVVAEAAKIKGLVNTDVIFVVSNSPKETSPKNEPLFSGVAPIYINSFRKPDAFNPSHTFENFVIGSSNNLAYLASTQAVLSLGSLYNPLFIYGPTGVGKTHLLQAFGNCVLTKVLDSKVLYVSAERFTNDYIESLNNRTQQAFRQKYRGVDVLLVDDIQFLAGKESTQDEFFFTFNELYLSGRQIVIASDRHPKELGRLKERLVSRFLGGMAVDITKPDLELRTAILRAKCKEKGVLLSDEILGYIAGACESGARELEGVLIQVLSLTKFSSGKITPEEIKSAIEKKQINVKSALTAGKVIESVAKHFKVSREDLCGPGRKSSFVYPRQILMFLLRKDLGLALDGVGELLGGRDHSTVLYGVDKIQKLLSSDQIRRDELARIRSIF